MIGKKVWKDMTNEMIKQLGEEDKVRKEIGCK